MSDIRPSWLDHPLVLFLALHKVGPFRISLYTIYEISSNTCVNAKYKENQALSGGLSSILRSDLILDPRYLVTWIPHTGCGYTQKCQLPAFDKARLQK